MVVDGIAYILISHGSSGYGSYGNDFSGVRAPLPDILSKEYPNTQVPADNTYWKMTASETGISPESPMHFDDVIFYKKAKDLLDDTKLGGRGW